MKKYLLHSLCAFILVLNAFSIFAQDLWVPSATGGFGDPNNMNIQCLHVFKGNLYAGTADDSAAIYSSPTGNYGSWQRRFSSPYIYGMRDFASTNEGGGYLYASTNSYSSIPPQVYRSADGNTWVDFYEGSNTVSHVAAFKGAGTVDTIYIVEQNYYGDVIKRAPYDSNDPLDTLSTWSTVLDLNSTYKSVNAMLVYNNKLYFTTTSNELYSTTDGIVWLPSSTVGTGFGDSNNNELTALGTYGGYLYVATYNYSTGAQIWRSNDDIAWTMVTQFPSYERITSFAAESTNLWVAMNNGNGNTGAVYKSADGLTFTSSETNGFGSPGDDGQYAQLAAFGNNMYCSTQNQYYGPGGPFIATAHPSTAAEKATTRGKSASSNGGEIWRTCLGTPPVVDLGSDQTICAGQHITLNAGPGTAFSWNTGDTTQTIQASGSAIGAIFYCFMTDASGCSNSDTVKITANNAPAIGVVNPIAQYATICFGDSTGLLNQVSSNYRVPQMPLHKTAHDSIYDNQSTYDTLAVSGISDLASAAIISVTIDSLYHTYDGDIEIGIYAPDGSYTQLSNRNGDSGDNYFGTVFTDLSISDISSSVPPYTGTYAAQGGFSSLSGPADGNWILAVTDYAGGDQGSIRGWSMQFSLADTVVTYSWTPSTGLSSSVIASPEVIPPSGTTIYTLTATNNAGCSSQISDTISVPAIHITASHDSLCAGGSAILSVTGSSSPVWSPGSSLSSTTGASVIATPAATTLYHVNDTLSGCAASDSLMVYVDAALVASAGTPQVMCAGDTLALNGVATGGTLPYNYAWSDGSTTATTMVSPPSTTNDILTVSDAFGCAAADTATVTVHPSTDIYGHVSYSGGAVAGSNVVIYRYEPYLVHFDTVMTTTTDASGNYHFTAVSHHNYLIEVFPAASYTTLLPGYYGDKPLWDQATIAVHDCMVADTFNIAAVEETSFGTGPGYLHGRITEDAGFDSGIGIYHGGHERIPGEPIPGIDVKLGHNPGGQMVTTTTTDGNGEYSFSSVPYGDYTVYVDIPGLARDSSYTFSVDSANYIYNYLDYTVDSTTIHYVPNAGVSVQDIPASASNNLSIYPNPSKGDATIEYVLEKEGDVSLNLYNVLGMKVKALAETHQQAGTYKCTISGRDGLRPGVYFVSLLTGGKTSTQRIIITE